MTVKTCLVEDARFDTETNRPVFVVEAHEGQTIDFAPAVSLEDLKASKAKRAKQKEAQINLSAHEESVELEQLLPETLMPDNIDAADLEVIEAPSLEDPAHNTDLETLVISPEDEQDLTQDSTINSGAELAGHILSSQEVLVPMSPDNNPQEARTNTNKQGAKVFTHENNTPPAHDQLAGLNILVVEDALANQIVIQSLLQPAGCNVAIAEHGQIAIDMLETQPFDVVLMDIRMPVMNGIEATMHIRNTPSAYQGIPIIALTADVSAETNAECLAAGADIFLTKPVVISELFSSIRFVREKEMRQKQDVLSA